MSDKKNEYQLIRQEIDALKRRVTTQEQIIAILERIVLKIPAQE